jgi:CRP-like cAMP-binding protein
MDHASTSSVNPARMSSELADVLAAMWLTHDLRAATRARLAALGSFHRAGPGEIVLREGEPSTYMAIIVEGRVALRLRVPERGQVTILTVEPGDVLAWSALVPPYRATSTATTIVETVMARFDAVTLRDALRDDETLAAELYPVVLRAVARRLAGTRQQLLDLFSQRQVEPW